MTTLETIFAEMRIKGKEIYFRNNLQGKNPINMNDMEIGIFFEKHDQCQFDFFRINLEVTTNYHIVEQKINQDKIPEEVKYILDILYKESKESYLVGGCIRDLIIGLEPKDWDFVTDISYERLSEIFSGPEFHVKETGLQFLVFNLRYRDFEFEIANFRTEIYQNGSRNPEVKVSNIYEDAKRRDLTICALFWNQEGVKADYESIKDIIDKKIRFVGRADDRLAEDYLRGWRFLRFSNKLKKFGFKPDENSLKAVRRNWRKIYQESNPTRVLLELAKLI